MRRWFSVLALSTPLLVGNAEARETRDIQETFEVSGGQIIRIDIPVAELRIEATDRDDVAVDLSVRCRWNIRDCEDALEDLKMASRSSSRRLTLELEGLRTWRTSFLDVEGSIEIPLSSALEVKMGVADLEIRGVERDLSVELGVGELDIRLPKVSLAEAFVDVGIGKIRFLGNGDLQDDRRSHLVGNELHWADGAGEAELDIEVGVGEVKVRLE